MFGIDDRFGDEFYGTGRGSLRAGEEELRRLESLFGPREGNTDENEDGRADGPADAAIRQRLVQRYARTPRTVMGWEVPNLFHRLEELRAAREFVDTQIGASLAAADLFLDGIPRRQCCETTDAFVRGQSASPGDFEACIRCRCMLVAHEVAWETAVRALPVGVPPREKEVPPPLDDNGVAIPRALLRLALEADEVAARAEAAQGGDHVGSRVAISSGIAPLWKWLASLGPKEVLPGEFLPGDPILLGDELGTVEITRVLSSNLMEISVPSRPKRTTLTRREMTDALCVHNRDVVKKASARSRP